MEQHNTTRSSHQRWDFSWSLRTDTHTHQVDFSIWRSNALSCFFENLYVCLRQQCAPCTLFSVCYYSIIFGLPPPEIHPSLKIFTSPLTFNTPNVSAEPGDVVQVCVDKYSPPNSQTPPVTINVLPIGPTSPHLSGFSGQQLYFPVAATQACFNLTLGSDQSSQSYTLGIQGSTEEMEIDVVSSPISTICGTFPISENNIIGNFSPDSNFVYSDRFGNFYTESEVQFSLTGGGWTTQAIFL